MIEKIYINGCSWSAGHDLDDMENDSWPGQLAELTGLEVINEAMCGGSNHRILRKTMKFLSENKSDWDKILVIPAWSCPSRTEFYFEDSEKMYAERYPKHVEHRLHQQNTDDWVWVNQYRARAFDEDDFLNNRMAVSWYLELESPELSYHDYIMDVLNLQNFCKANNIKYFQFRAFQFENIATTNHSKLLKWFGVGGSKQTSEYDCEHIFKEVAKRGGYENLIDLVDRDLFPSFINTEHTLHWLSKTPTGVHPSKEHCGILAKEVQKILIDRSII